MQYLILLLLLPPLLAGAAGAGATTTAARLRACAAIGEADRRLQCYDGVAAALAPPGPAQNDPTALPPSAATVQDSGPAADFGREHWQGERETDRITARVNAVSRDAAGKLVVGLDNGQVWRQLKAETVRIAIDDRVVIERGMLASFFFRVNDSSRKIKFTRVR